MTLPADILDLAKPLSPEEVAVEAWFMDSTDEDQRKPHRQNPNVQAPPSVLHKVGVISWRLDADTYENDPKLEAIRKVRNYTYQDIITVSPKMDAYEDKIKSFFEEHIHDDEEIRYILDGSGYFDVRDADDKWVRIACGKGDMIVLPAGMYHRFTLDENNYIKAMRLFVGDPVWTPINRSPEADAHPARGQYLTAMAA